MHIINNKVLKIISNFFLFHIRKILFFLSLKYLNQIVFYFFLCEHKLHINTHIKKKKFLLMF
jgi:hypothetical protein